MHDAGSNPWQGAFIALLIGAAGVLLAVVSTRSTSSEDAALTSARAQRSGGHDVDALAGLLACSRDNPRACRCADEGEQVAVDLGLYREAWAAVEHAQCDEGPRHLGARAEALVANDRTAEGVLAADAALARDPGEPHACYARAWAMSSGGSPSQALSFADRAVAAGRGLPALLLAGMLRFRSGDIQGARQAFDDAAKIAPSNARVVYDVALVAQNQGRYREAREGYLKALSIDPKMVDARYNLAVLTHAAGADDEARHHLDALAAIAPGDPRIAGLRAMLAQK
jgi:tetratricopeptide (TPR) repeat protein